MSKLTRYLVVSFDSDEQQSFYDFVDAPAASLAMEIVARARDYADVQDTWTVEDLNRTALQMRTAKDVPASAFTLARQLDGVEVAEWCLVCDCRVDDCAVDHEEAAVAPASCPDLHKAENA